MTVEAYKKFADYFLDYNMNIDDLPKNNNLANVINIEEKRRLLVLLRYKAEKSTSNKKYLYKIVNLKSHIELEPAKFYELFNNFKINQLKEYLQHCK